MLPGQRVGVGRPLITVNATNKVVSADVDVRTTTWLPAGALGGFSPVTDTYESTSRVKASLPADVVRYTERRPTAARWPAGGPRSCSGPRTARSWVVASSGPMARATRPEARSNPRRARRVRRANEVPGSCRCRTSRRRRTTAAPSCTPTATSPCRGRTSTTWTEASAPRAACVAASESTKMSSPSWASSAVSVIGGAMRSTFPSGRPCRPAAPRSCDSSGTRRGGRVRLRGRSDQLHPIISPLPRTSPTSGRSSGPEPVQQLGAAGRAVRLQVVVLRYCSIASAPDVETGLPPNVEIEFA